MSSLQSLIRAGVLVENAADAAGFVSSFTSLCVLDSVLQATPANLRTRIHVRASQELEVAGSSALSRLRLVNHVVRCGRDGRARAVLEDLGLEEANEAMRGELLRRVPSRFAILAWCLPNDYASA